jgi:hypothetical protein
MKISKLPRALPAHRKPPEPVTTSGGRTASSWSPAVPERRRPGGCCVSVSLTLCAAISNSAGKPPGLTSSVLPGSFHQS